MDNSLMCCDGIAFTHGPAHVLLCCCFTHPLSYVLLWPCLLPCFHFVIDGDPEPCGI